MSIMSKTTGNKVRQTTYNSIEMENKGKHKDRNPIISTPGYKEIVQASNIEEVVAVFTEIGLTSFINCIESSLTKTINSIIEEKMESIISRVIEDKTTAILSGVNTGLCRAVEKFNWNSLVSLPAISSVEEDKEDSKKAVTKKVSSGVKNPKLKRIGVGTYDIKTLEEVVPIALKQLAHPECFTMKALLPEMNKLGYTWNTDIHSRIAKSLCTLGIIRKLNRMQYCVIEDNSKTDTII